jgi:protein N-terminal methyltransferase
LTNNGCIIVKENHASGEEKDFDVEDYSWTRTGSEYQSLFEQAGLQVVYEKKQKNFPRGMYEVRMYALKPRTFNE